VLWLACLLLQDVVLPRGGLDNSRLRFERDKKGHVAFLGGSITEMNGYRPRVMDLLKRRFPEAAFQFTDAGLASTCSTTGAFRLEADVLSNGPVDLLFVEFAVNDDQDAGHSRESCVRGMEGIVRHARRHNPRADIVITYFLNPEMLETLQAGKTPLTIAAHEEVAAHYGVPSVHLAKEVARRVGAGTLTWKDYGGTHPAKAGNALAADLIDGLLERVWARPAEAAPPRPLPEPLDPLCYERGRFIDPGQARFGPKWTLGVPDWPKIPGNLRDRFKGLPVLEGTLGRTSRDLVLEFEGTAIGAYVLAGPDAGVAHFYIGDDFEKGERVNFHHRFSKDLHYPRTVMFATGLKPGKHKLTLGVAGVTYSDGYALRILKFVVN
jgi:lysophospholipase L1-like esterase